jgi:CheY-like chemotaxis protein
VTSARLLKVLVCDDDEDDRLLIEEALKAAPGIEWLTSVSSGLELMEYLTHSACLCLSDAPPRPDIILLDLNMPVMDGREALRQIKSSPSYRAIPVVVLTTSSQEADVVNAYVLGASAFLTKPETFQELVGKINAMAMHWTETVRLPVDPSCVSCHRMPGQDRLTGKNTQGRDTRPVAH